MFHSRFSMLEINKQLLFYITLVWINPHLFRQLWKYMKILQTLKINSHFSMLYPAFSKISKVKLVYSSRNNSLKYLMLSCLVLLLRDTTIITIITMLWFTFQPNYSKRVQLQLLFTYANYVLLEASFFSCSTLESFITSLLHDLTQVNKQLIIQLSN